MSRQKNDDKVARVIMKYMLPIGAKEYPIEVEIRFPHDLNESVAKEVKRLFWPFTPSVEKVNFPKEPEMEVEVEDEDFTKVEVETKIPKARAGRRASSRSKV